MPRSEPFTDIHGHFLPGIDDGADDWGMSLAMARMAVDEGFRTVVATPHQLGGYAVNSGDIIRRLTVEYQQRLDAENVALQVLPGADVRIEDGMIGRLRRGDVLTLGDQGRHVLLELPHEIFMPLEGLLEQLTKIGIVGILSHPERNQGILRQSNVLKPLVNAGCLMQVTAGSIDGAFGERIRRFTEWMLQSGLVHLIATDAHGVETRQPTIRQAFERTCQLTDDQTGIDLCCRHPAAVAAGEDVSPGRRQVKRRRLSTWLRRAG